MARSMVPDSRSPIIIVLPFEIRVLIYVLIIVAGFGVTHNAAKSRRNKILLKQIASSLTQDSSSRIRFKVVEKEQY